MYVCTHLHIYIRIYVHMLVLMYASIQRSSTEDTMATPNPINPFKDQKQWQLTPSLTQPSFPFQLPFTIHHSLLSLLIIPTYPQVHEDSTVIPLTAKPTAVMKVSDTVHFIYMHGYRSKKKNLCAKSYNILLQMQCEKVGKTCMTST